MFLVNQFKYFSYSRDSQKEISCAEIGPTGKTCHWHPRCFRGCWFRAKALDRWKVPEDVRLLIFSIRRHSPTLHAGDLKCQHRMANRRKACHSCISGTAVNTVFWWSAPAHTHILKENQVPELKAGSCIKSLWHTNLKSLLCQTPLWILCVMLMFVSGSISPSVQLVAFPNSQWYKCVNIFGNI